MKHLLITLLLIVTCTLSVQAQDVAKGTETAKERQARREAEIETLKAQKVAYLTQEIGLTRNEAEKFWPLYNDLQTKLDRINELRGSTKWNMRKIVFPAPKKNATPVATESGRSKAGDARAPMLPQDVQEPITDQQIVEKAAEAASDNAIIERLLESYFSTFEQEIEVRMEYYTLFRDVLSAEKVAKLYLAEERFQDKLIRDFINQRAEEKASTKE